jgi:YVTN family beta-propeller protein
VMGDVLQSIALYNNRAFMVMNNSRKVVVTNANTFKAEGEIGGLEMPRYFVALDDNKGYVTEWVTYSGKGRVAVVDLKTLAVTNTIEVGINPERMLLLGGKLYVANRDDNFISVINTATDAVEASIPVTHGPNGLALDNSNNLWVASAGLKVYDDNYKFIEEESKPGALVKINTSSNTVVSTLNFTSKAAAPGNLTTSRNGAALYYTYNGNTYQQDINNSTLSTAPLIRRSFNALGVDPASNYLYAARFTDYTSNGWVIRYNPTGAAVDSFRVDIAPNGFVFR